MGSQDPPNARPRRRAPALLGLLVAAVLALAAARLFLFDVYRVDSGSMEPFLHGDAESGERVLVRYARRPALERFDPVVILLPGASEPVVKRVVGLPGESLQLVGGDLVIDGKRLGADVPRPACVPLFDSARAPLDEFLQVAGPGWTSEGAVWRLDARGTGPAMESAAAWTARLYDGRTARDGSFVAGVTEVGDVVLELELELLGPFDGAGRVEVGLTEEADRFRLELRPGPERLAAALWRAHPVEGESRLAAVEVLRPAGRLRVRFANVDNHLRVDLGNARGVLAADYASNAPLESSADRSYRHLRPRVVFGAVGLEVRFERVRIARDLHWGERGGFGVEAPLRLGPDELFVLGDNASESLDSREYGPVPLDAVIGVPVAVVW
ncbi:MAG TPA: signal peptidase I, partial [Planctomycetota bacterium]|nr:signal peptidase I [Planctomycetota bacterium]